MDPIDYSGAFANLPSPLATFTNALQVGSAVRQLDMQQEQQQAQLAQQEALRTDLAALAANPTPENIARMTLKHPQLSESFKRSYDMQTAAQKEARLNAAIPIFTAVQNGRNDLASQMLRERATALENSGQQQEAAQTRAMADLVEQHPDTAKLTMGNLLAATMGADKFIETFKGIGEERRANDEAPFDLAKKKSDAAAAEADAKIKGVDAKYAEPEKLLKLEGFRTDIQFKKDQTRIGYLGAQIAKARNDIERQRLQVDLNKAISERDDRLRSKVADAESAASSIDNMLNNIDRILSVATDKNGKATSTLRAAAGPLDSRLPTMQGDVADLEALTETLGAQAFLSQIPNIKGMGALSNAEGEKLQTAFQNFSLKQSPEQIIYNLKEAKRLLGNGRNTISKRYGVQLGNPNTPASADKRPPLSSFGG